MELGLVRVQRLLKVIEIYFVEVLNILCTNFLNDRRTLRVGSIVGTRLRIHVFLLLNVCHGDDAVGFLFS
jgi:hypothetical protein